MSIFRGFCNPPTGREAKQIRQDNCKFSNPRKDLALSLHQALKGITIDAAQSWRMEEEIGSIKVGKIAINPTDIYRYIIRRHILYLHD